MKIVFIGCGARKRKEACKAKDMYIGPLFVKALQYAGTLNADRIYVLSAKYHLLSLDKVISPYDETLNKKTSKEIKEWSRIVVNRMREDDIDLHKDELVFLCGVRYYKYLLDNIGNPSNVVLPYKDCKGIGYILQFLNNTLK